MDAHSRKWIYVADSTAYSLYVLFFNQKLFYSVRNNQKFAQNCNIIID